MKERLKGCSDGAVELVNALLTYDPEKRPSARGALRFAYWEESPRACRPEMVQTAPEIRNEGAGAGKRVVVGREREERGDGGYVFEFEGGERKRRRR